MGIWVNGAIMQFLVLNVSILFPILSYKYDVCVCGQTKRRTFTHSRCRRRRHHLYWSLIGLPIILFVYIYIIVGIFSRIFAVVVVIKVDFDVCWCLSLEVGTLYTIEMEKVGTIPNNNMNILMVISYNNFTMIHYRSKKLTYPESSVCCIFWMHFF